MSATPLSVSDAVEVDAIDRQAGRLIALGGWTIVVIVGGMLLWLLYAPLAGAAYGSGMVRVDTQRKTVQHRDGGIVKTILVREGQHVTAGATLVELEDVRLDASADALEGQLAAEQLKASRLAAERLLASSWAPPADIVARGRKEPRLAAAIAQEVALFKARRARLDGQIALTRKQMDDVKVQLAAREREFASASQALALMDEEIAANQRLLEQNYVNKVRVVTLQRSAAEYRMRIDDNRAETAKAAQTLSDLELRLASVGDGTVQEASNDLRDTQARIVEIEERLRAARDATDHKLIVAPVSGRVIDLKVTTPGSALGPRDPVLDIVPDDAPLIVETRLPVDAVQHLRTGQQADVRLTAVKLRAARTFIGEVVYVSADALEDRRTGAPYYLAHVKLDRAALDEAGVELRPGMAAEVFVRTRERTAFDYLSEPFTAAMHRAFRE
ncbi:HlyD family type I secretion periplasmic adaptor subunit [Derxia gummosa]|uniref:Membrane fusion protein (MFP) family protein n=1 Tax=Derxia gummosa DSM 723 TaxID=1121388 RepID=A0A8B6X5N0_9BURK|nr:HlyD family type I secretion periplasmic adaptor subunit [Derxia gummosa]